MSFLNKSIGGKKECFLNHVGSAGSQSGSENSRQGLYHQVSPSASNVVSVTTGRVKGSEGQETQSNKNNTNAVGTYL